MNILWVATKAPWPPIDGGRLLLLNTLHALSSAGHRLTLVAPIGAGADAGRADPGTSAALAPFCRPSLVPVGQRPLAVDLLRSQLTRSPLTLVRHAHAAVRRRVRRHLREEAFDLVQAEQVQALDAALQSESAGEMPALPAGPASETPALPAGPPVLLRAQNVESDLWSQAARHARWRRPLLALEARRLASREGRAVRRVSATIALTAEDAERLGALGGAPDRVHHVPAPFEPELPAAPEPLLGSPPVVLFGSAGWRPNAAGAEWFLRRAWPRMRSARPEAVLHVFGIAAGGDGVVSHPAPADSRDAYPPGGVLVVPLAIASGVRIKILEAWARGTAVIATPQAARGLAAEDGEQLLLARAGADFATALSRLGDAELTARLIAAGRRHLRRRHDASQVARHLGEIYRDVTR